MARTATARRPAPVQQQIAEMQKQLETVLAENERLKSATPANRSTMVDTGEIADPIERDILMPSMGEARLESGDIATPDGPVTRSKLEELAFMDEPVEIEVSASGSDMDHPVFSLWNDGRHQLIVRGKRQVVKRKFVEVLARSKKVVTRSEQYVDAQGVRHIKYPQSIAPKYPFVVHRDSPKGRDWLRKVLSEP